MTKYEVKDVLSQYYKDCCAVDCLRKRIEVLRANDVGESEVRRRLEELAEKHKKAVLNEDLALANALELINKLDNADGDVDVLRKYHIDGLSEKTIAKQLHLSVDYIRKKRWRAYEKISRIK